MEIYFYNPFADGFDFSLGLGFDYSIRYKYVHFALDFIFVTMKFYKEWK